MIQNAINRVLYFGNAFKLASKRMDYYDKKTSAVSGTKQKMAKAKPLQMRKKAFASAIDNAQARMTQRNAFKQALSGFKGDLL